MSHPALTPELIAYAAKRITYSGEDFDRVQHIATVLTEADRQAGRPSPKYGYSKENVAIAEQVMRNRR